MARRIYARFEDRPDGHIEVLVSKGGVDRIVPLEDAGLKASDDVVVFVPGIDVASHNASVPARREREARKAAAFSIEDDVAEPVEALHVALSPKGDDDQRTILVCSSKLMAAWTERLDEAGLHDAMILPEFAVLPELNSAIDIEGRILLNIEARRMAVESTAPDDLLRAIVNSASQPLDVHGTLLAGRLGVDAIGEVDAEPLGTLKSFAEADLQLIDLR
ncbi:MAG: type II secretion system protein GspL, partial [Pseudomonadota bacterium]